MAVTPDNLLAILAMAVATYATRLCGLWVAEYIPAGGRMRAALDALPAAVLAAVVAPMALATGPAETFAAVITVLAAMRLPRARNSRGRRRRSGDAPDAAWLSATALAGRRRRDTARSR